ncbi:MAG: 3 beta-hydroxysteroid dehydrogenase/Delta 5--_4-isomerase [Chloroflexi bacterium ADurb.Bin325]|nr:MAG: 3 beta-hydroxysteroid dehydrogenase/Delta 5-->4-isomerase [Chloroflexi bacterium ADurb.Bin325]
MNMNESSAGPVLITGVTGFIASHLAERLLAAGVPVRGAARRPAAADWLAARGADIVSADLLDPPALARAARGCRAVVHAAAWTGGPETPPDLAWRTNVDGTANVLAAAAGVARFIYISSVAVYGVNRAPVIDEAAATPRVGQAYPDSKITAEALVRGSGLPYVIIRPASTYGPRGDAWTLGPLRQIKAGRLVLLGRDEGLVTPGYIDNVVDGLLLALAHSAAVGEAFNLCDDRAVTYREFYLAYARMLNLDRLPTVPGLAADLARLPAANWLRGRLGRAPVGPWSLHFRRNPSQFSIAKAQRILGYAPRIDFAAGMRLTEAWLRAEGHLD